MLELRSHCEHCGRALPPSSDEAMICTYECTFCRQCATEVLSGICPNCTGNLVDRPIRPATALRRHPGATEPFVRPVDLEKHAVRVARLGGTPAADR